MRNGWETKRLSEFAVTVSTGPFGSLLHKSDYVDHGVPLVNPINIVDDEIVPDPSKLVSAETKHKLSSYVLEPGDIVVARRGEIGRCAVVGPHENGWVCGTGCFFIRPLSTMNSVFLANLLRSCGYRERLDQLSTGTTMKNLSNTALGTLLVSAPSLVEQQRIVGVLDEAFAGFATAQANAERNLQNARALFESHLQSIFSQRGNGWVDRPLHSLCNEITVGHVGPMKSEYRANGVPFLRSQNIRPFEVSMEGVMFIDDEFHRALRKSRLRPGDVAIVRTGYPGTAAVVPSNLPDSNCSDLVIVRPNDEVSPHFLAAFFNSSFGKQMVLGKLVGAAQKHFNVTAAKEVVLHLPTIKEQIAIVRIVDSLRADCERLEDLYQQKLAALAALKKSLLHQAFNGDL